MLSSRWTNKSSKELIFSSKCCKKLKHDANTIQKYLGKKAVPDALCLLTEGTEE